MRTLLVIVLLVVLFFALRILLKAAPAKTAWFVKRLAWTAGILVFLFLLLTGRMHWLFALVAAAIPLAQRALPYLRYFPIINSLWKRYGGQVGQNGSGSSGQYSSVNSYYIAMTLGHNNGVMDGTVLQGQFKGACLQAMSLEQLLQLYAEIQDDKDSVALLQAYLDHTHSTWREQAQTAGANQSANEVPVSNSMSHTEACQILGVETDAGKSEIIAAHKRLIQRIHPDRGGSSYLAVKINQAKDFLLRKNPN